MTYVLYANLDNFSTDQLKKLIDLIPKSYLFGSSQQEIRRDESYLGRLLLYFGLTSYFKLNEPVDFGLNAHGKPFITFPENAPHFSITHSKKIVAVAISLKNVGIDIEMISPTSSLLLSKHYFSQAELIDLVTNKNKDMYFYKLWTLKESYSKYIGSGLHLDFSQIEFSYKSNLPYLTKKREDIDISFLPLSLYPNYVCSLCHEDTIIVTNELTYDDFFQSFS